MPWTTPEIFTAGQTLTAASMNIVSGNARMGQPVFTNEAARDAAITSPEEGMTAYLTAPTVPAATGAITMVPTGVRTVYNGTAWVCVTPVGCRSETMGTRANAAYSTTLTGDGTALSVTLVTGTTALVQMFKRLANSAGGETVWTTVSVSGATTIAANDANGFSLYELGAGQSIQRTLILTGLTAGTNTFTLNYRNTAGTVSYYHRDLVVVGIA